MTLFDAVATFLIGILSGVLSVLAGGGVTVVLPVLLGLGLSADHANATSRFNLTVGAIIATIVLIRKKNVDWTATRPFLIATVVGAAVGAWLGTLVHSTVMLTIIVLTSVVSMILVYMRPNRWLSTAPATGVLSEYVGAFVYGLLCLYGGVVAVDSAILRLIVLVLPAQQGQPDQGRHRARAVCHFLGDLRRRRQGQLGRRRMARGRNRHRFICGVRICRDR